MANAQPGPGPGRRPPGEGKQRPDEFRDLPQPVRKLLQSVGRLTYSGQRVVEFKLDGERYRNIELLVVDRLRSRVEFGTDSSWAGQIIVESPKGRQHYFPQANEIRILPPMRDESVLRLRGMLTDRSGRIRISFGQGGVVAGRQTTAVTAADPQGNVLQKLWIDNEFGLALKREIFDPVGSRIGYYEFSKINFRPNIQESDFVIRRAGAKVVTQYDMVRKLAKKEGFVAAWIPASTGAELVNVRTSPMQGTKALMQAYEYDGRRVSLFQLRGNVDPRRIEKLGGGRLNVYRWTASNLTFVIVSDLPTETLTKLARTVVTE